MPRFTVNYEDSYDQRPPAYQQPTPPPPQQQSFSLGIIPIPILILCIPVILAVFRPVVFTMPNGGSQPVIINNKNG